MKNLVILLVLVFSINTANAQLSGQAKIDSLLKELPKMKKDKNAVNLLSSLSFEYRGINPDEGIKYGKQGVIIAEEIGWKLGKANCFNSLGVNKRAKSNYPKALVYFHKALKINEELGSKSSMASTLVNIGNVLSSQSNYSEALDYYLRALKINEKLDRKIGIASNFGNIGIIYYYLEKYKQSLIYYNKALTLNKKLGRKVSVANNLINIGIVYENLSLDNKALENYTKAFKIYEELGDEIGIGVTLENIGVVLTKQSEFVKALDYFNQSLLINEKFKNKNGIASNLGNIGKLYLKLSQDSIIEKSENRIQLLLNREVNLNKSIEYSKRAIEIFEEIGAIYEKSYYLNNLSKAFNLKGDFKRAFEVFKEHKELNDSVFNQENTNKISALEKLREDDIKQAEIEKQKAIVLEQEKREQVVIYSAIIVFFLIALILVLIINSKRKSEKLLLNILPAKIAKRLKAKEHPIADQFDGASIMFVDIVGFTKLSSDADPKRIVSVLNDIFTIFDKLADTYGLEKIKTIGDSYMAVCGIPEINTQHAKQTALMALEIKKIMTGFTTSDGTEIHFRIGIDCGPVVAGVIGEKKFIYDLWSDAVNTASRMESTGEKGKIQITDNFKNELEKYAGDWKFELRGEFDIKGKGLMQTYYLEN